MPESLFTFDAVIEEAGRARAEASRLRARAQTLRAQTRRLRAEIASLHQASAATLSRASDHSQSNLTPLPDSDVLAPEVVSHPAGAVVHSMPATFMTDAELHDFTQSLIVAYKNATAGGDDEAAALFGKALRQIGRHLAHQLGPKAARVVLN